jgi:hypothetical protein
MPDKTAFLSSTGRDLTEYREAAYRAIEGLDGWKCVWMEDFGARDWGADEFCCARVAECDLLVGIVGHLHGSCPPGSVQSFTEQEYEAALAAGAPCLMFLAPEGFLVPANLIESARKRKKQSAFRERVSTERIRDTFVSPDDLAWRVVRAIHNWEQELTKAETATLIPTLDRLLWPEASDEAATAGVRGKDHGELVEALYKALDRQLGEYARVSTLHSLGEAGCDIEVFFHAQRLKYGVQIKSHVDIKERDFATKTLAQIQDSRRHALNRLYLVLAGDLTDKSQREKVRNLHSRIDQMQDEYVVVVPPERMWTLFCKWAPSSEAGHKSFAVSLPPQPYFAHPYPLQENFAGRVPQRRMLTAWLTGDQRPVLALVAIGGMGKSSLAWAWLQRDVLGLPLRGSPSESPEVGRACRVPKGARPEGVLWWSFYGRETGFGAFLDGAVTYASGGSVDPAAIPSAHEKAEALVDLLGEHRLLLVLDGFERQLRAYAELSAVYRRDVAFDSGDGDSHVCIDPHAAAFLARAAAGPLPSRVLLTSRLFPRELDGTAGCRHEELTGLDPADAVVFFRAVGVKGTRAKIEAACAAYGYLPLALRLLAGMIVGDKGMPGDIRVADRHPVLPKLKDKERSRGAEG